MIFYLFAPQRKGNGPPTPPPPVPPAGRESTHVNRSPFDETAAVW